MRTVSWCICYLSSFASPQCPPAIGSEQHRREGEVEGVPISIVVLRHLDVWVKVIWRWRSMVKDGHGRKGEVSRES